MAIKKNIATKLVHLFINTIPFALVYFISPYIEYENYDFLYLVSHRKFWYIWLIPLIFIMVGKIKWAHIFTACATLSMPFAQYKGDIRYRQELVKARQGNYYPHANHFGLWLGYTFASFLRVVAIHFFIKRNKSL